MFIRRQKHLAMSLQHSSSVPCSNDSDDKCKVRQISVLFPGMDDAVARSVAQQGKIAIPKITTIKYLTIDSFKQLDLDEEDEGIRMFFHASESKKLKWWERKIARLSGTGNGKQFLFKRRDDRQAPAHLKLWEEEKYARYKHEFEQNDENLLLPSSFRGPQVHDIKKILV
jgi:hypothetical protein